MKKAVRRIAVSIFCATGEGMRVIAGTARSLPLVAPEGDGTRPTTDRIKETLFNILNFQLPGCRFLDLFAGSGGIGIEALSRGASRAVFVDNNKKAVDCIRRNLTFTRLADRGEILSQDVLAALGILERREKESFDIIFLDPPYGMQWENQVLDRLMQGRLVGEDTQIIVETALDTDFAWAERIGAEVRREKKYKTNKHVWLRRR